MENTVKFSKRFSAYLIDILLVYLVISLVVNIRFINPYYDKYSEELNKYNELIDKASEDLDIDGLLKSANESYYKLSKYSAPYNIVIIVLVIAYFGIFQKFNNGQTLGKKLMKIKVVSNDDSKKVSVLKYILRTMSLQYIAIGNISALIINTCLVFILKANQYLIVSSAITYLFLIVNIVSAIMIMASNNKRGIHDFISGTKVVME